MKQKLEAYHLPPGITEIECFKHYCRLCHEMDFVPRTPKSSANYPRCCGKPMAYLGVVTAKPGRDESLKKMEAAPRQRALDSRF